MARIGVVLSSFNRPAGLEAAVASLLAQTHADWRCVIADDHSTDPRVGEVVRAACAADPRVTALTGHEYVTDAQKRTRLCTLGAWINRSLAILEADGCELFSYLLDDVVYHPERCASHAATLEAFPSVFLVWGEQWLVERDERGEVVRERYQVPAEGLGDRTGPVLRAMLMRQNCINHCSATHRRMTRRWSENPAHWQTIDWQLWKRLFFDDGLQFMHVPVVGETMTSTPRDIGPMLSAGRSIAEVAAARRR